MLCSPRHAFGDGLQQRRAEHGAPGCWFMSTRRTRARRPRQCGWACAAVGSGRLGVFGVGGRLACQLSSDGRPSPASPWRPARVRARWPGRAPSSGRLPVCSWSCSSSTTMSEPLAGWQTPPCACPARCAPCRRARQPALRRCGLVMPLCSDTTAPAPKRGAKRLTKRSSSWA